MVNCTDCSKNALSLARAVDRALQNPGQYHIDIHISEYPPYTWDVTICRIDPLFRMMKSRPALTIASDL